MKFKEELRLCQQILGVCELEPAGETQIFQLRHTKPQRIISERKAWSFFQQLKVCSQSEFRLKKMEEFDSFADTKTIPCWIDPNLCAPWTNRQHYKVFSAKLTPSSLVIEK